MTDTLSPTRERIAKGHVEPPERSQKQSRQYHRAIDVFERMRLRGTLDSHQLDALKKMERHLLGSLGVDVRSGDGGGFSDVEGIPSITYHSSKVAEVSGIVPDRQFAALSLVVLEGWELAKVGTVLCKFKSPGAAIAAATVLVQEASSCLVKMWGMGAIPRKRSGL
jgi:hypothetical protein